MSNTIFGPLAVVQAPWEGIPQFILSKNLPKLLWGGTQETDLWLPHGWFYEFEAPELADERPKIVFWCAGGDRTALQLTKDGRLRIQVPSFEEAAELDLPALLDVAIESEPPRIFPDETLVLGEANQSIPRAVFLARWAAAVDLTRSKTTRSKQRGAQGELRLECRTGLPNGASVEATLAARTVEHSIRAGAPPALGVWPSFVRPSWRLHRIYADFQIARRANDASDQQLEATLLALESSEDSAWLRPLVTLDRGLAPALSVKARDGATGCKSALLLENPNVTAEILWFIVERPGKSGEGSTRSALFSADVSNKIPAWEGQTIAGARTLGIDLGTTTTTVAGGEREGEKVGPQPFSIDRRAPQWKIAWAGTASTEELATDYLWLPWVSSDSTRLRDESTHVWNQFPTQLRLVPTPTDCAADSTELVAGQRVCASLTRAFETEWPTLRGSETTLAGPHLSRPGALKWDTLKHDSYATMRVLFLEQLLTFAAHDVRFDGQTPADTVIVLRATCPSRFSEQHRLSYAKALIQTSARLREWTGLNLQVGGIAAKPGDHSAAVRTAATLRDESEPLLHTVISRAYLGHSDEPALVLVADLGGETLDLGLYAKVDMVSFVEIFADSFRCGGHGAIRQALPLARRDDTSAWEKFSYTIRDFGTAALDVSEQIPKAFREDVGSVFASRDEREIAADHFEMHAMVCARATGSLLECAAAEVARLADGSGGSDFRLDEFDYARIERKNPQDPQFRSEWFSFSANQWQTAALALKSLVGGQVPAAPSPATMHPPERAASAPSAAMAKFRDWLTVRLEDARSEGRAEVASFVATALSRYDDAIAADAGRPISPPASTPSAAPAAVVSPTESREVIVFLTGNGWRLSQTSRNASAADVIVTKVLAQLQVPKFSVINGTKLDAVLGLLQGGNASVLRRYGRTTNRLECLIPHGVRLPRMAEEEARVYDTGQRSQFLRVLTQSLAGVRTQPGEFFQGAGHIRELSKNVSEAHDRHAIRSRVAVALGAAHGTETFTRIEAWAKDPNNNNLDGPAQKLMLEALYSEER